jgi:hypothetical protein
MNALNSNRRDFFFHILTGCAGAGLCHAACQTALAAPPPGAWTEKDRVPLGGKGAEIIRKAQELGREYHTKYGGCSQTSLAAIQDSVPFVPNNDLVFLAATPLSGGATRSRNASCGAFTGGGLAIGLMCGRSRQNFASPSPLASKLILELSDRFVQTWGGVLCNDIRPKVGGKCAETVAQAAGWTAEILLKHFSDYQG